MESSLEQKIIFYLVIIWDSKNNYFIVRVCLFVCLFVLVYLEYFEHLKYFTLGFEAY